jgi:hypothetical protein
VPYDPATWLPVPDPAVLPAIEDITLDAFVSESPARAEPHDPAAWLPLPDDLESLPPLAELLAPAAFPDDDLERDVEAVEAVVAPSPARAEPHDPASWLPVPDPALLMNLPELEEGDASPPRAPTPRRTSRMAFAMRSFLFAVLIAATALAGIQFATRSSGSTAPKNAFDVTVDLDGEMRSVSTTERHASGLMRQMKVGKLVGLRNIPGRLHEGSEVVLRTRHNGTLVVDDQRVPFDSASRTVYELLAAYNIVLAGDDYTRPGLDAILDDGQEITVLRVGGDTKQRVEPIAFAEEHQPDPNTDIGEHSDLRPGVDGVMTVTYRERIENGVVVGTTVLSQVRTRDPVSHVIGDGTRADWHWDALAHCESGGRWSTIDHLGDGYDGGLGIYRGTWNAFGGREFAPNAGLATREEQIIVGMRIQARYGWGAWGCARNVLHWA